MTEFGLCLFEKWQIPIDNNLFSIWWGSASKFWLWKKLQVQADIWALKLLGRDNRISEPLVTSSADLVDSIIKVLPPDSKIPFIFYGHSMGAGLSFQTILQLQKQRKLMPELLIASGREAPHLKFHGIKIQLSDENIVKYIQELGNRSGKISKNEEFIKQYIPKIKADYILSHDIPVEEPTPLSLHIYIINGGEDPLVRKELLSEWQKHTLYPITSTISPGGHFFYGRIS